MMPRSLSDLPISFSRTRSGSVTHGVLSQEDASIVGAYALLRCGDKSVDILEHSSSISVLTFKDSTQCKHSYAIGESIGEGQEGTVQIAQDILSRRVRLVAVKRRDYTTSMGRDDCKAEYSILEYLKVGLHFVKVGYVCYIFMRYYRGFNASNIPDSWGDMQRQGIVCGMLRCVLALHEAGVYHGDIKPSNFVIQEKNLWIVVRLIDMGQAIRIGSPPSLSSPRGTPMYQPPEARRRDCRLSMSSKTEYYSLAITQAEVLSKYSYTEYQMKKGRFDPYKHGDLISCCHDVFMDSDELSGLRSGNQWRYEILRLLYSMYVEDIENRADTLAVCAYMSVLDELEVCALKRTRTTRDFDIKDLREMYNIYPKMCSSPSVSPRPKGLLYGTVQTSRLG